MTVAFISEDPINCPLEEYKIEKVNLYQFSVYMQGYEAEVSNQILIDKKTGLFTLINCTEPMQWQIWLSCKGPDGTGSGLSDTWNIQINLYKPPPIVTYPPYFRFNGETATRNHDGSYNVTKYIQTYANLTWFDYPNKHPQRMYYVYEFPSIIDPQNLAVELDIQESD